MQHAYDIFEKFPDGSFMWETCVEGEHNARRKLQELQELSENEFFAIDILAGELLPFILKHSAGQTKQAQPATRRVA